MTILQERPDELIALLRPEFAGTSGAGGVGTLTWGKILYIPINGGVVQSFPVTQAGRDAAVAAALAGAVAYIIWVPTCNIAGDFTVPAFGVIASMGNRATFTGKVTLGVGAAIKGITVTVTGSSAGELIAVECTATTAINFVNDCGINCENTGAGAATAIKVNGAGHETWVWGTSVYGNASGGGAGYGVSQAAGTAYVSDDGRIRGSTGKFSGEIKLFSFDDVIKVKTGTFTKLYNATAAGVAAALSGSASGDRIEFPRRIQIAMTAGITVPASVAMIDFNLSFSGFSGIAITLSGGSRLSNGRAYFDGTGQAVATAVSALDTNADIVRCDCIAVNATGNTGIHARGSSLHVGVSIILSTAQAQNGTTNKALLLEQYTYTSWSYGQSTGGSAGNTGAVLQGTVSGAQNAPILHATWCFGTGTAGRGLIVDTNDYGTVINSHFYGATEGMLINSGATLYHANCDWDTKTNSGTMTKIPGSDQDGGASDIVFNVKDYGAVGDGSTDDSTAVQDTINAADDVGGIVFFPPGKYRLVTGVTLNTFTTMRGVSYHPQHHTSSPSTDYHFGSWIYVEDTVNPAITAKSGTGIQGLSFFYPNQAAGSSPPTTYPATIKLHDNGANLTTRVTIRDCFFQNPFYAINAEAAHEMMTVENCQGYPLSVGISIDQNSDIDRIDKVHFNPNCWREGETNSTTLSWVNANGTAFRVKKADWVRITNCFAYGYWIGLYLLDSVSGHTNDLIVSESGFDNCENCIYVTGAAEGIKVIDCDIVAENPNTTAGNHGITLINTGEVLVSECRIWGTSGHGIYIHGPSFVNIIDNLIMEFGLNSSASNTYYGIIIDSNGVDRALIKGNEINGNSRNFIVGILLVGSANITNVEITHNHIHNMTLSGIYLNAGPTNIICRDNNLQSTGGLTNSLGAIVKDVRNNIVGSTLTSGPRARAYHNASQNVNNVTTTALALNSERVDTDSIHDTATNNSRLTCRTPGSYLIIGNFRFAPDATGVNRLGIIRLNGATEIARDFVSPAEVIEHQVNPTTIYELALGDYVELCAYQDSGGILAVQSVAQYTPEFMMQRLP